MWSAKRKNCRIKNLKDKNNKFLHEGKDVTERGNLWSSVIGRGPLFFGGGGSCWGKADEKVFGKELKKRVGLYFWSLIGIYQRGFI